MVWSYTYPPFCIYTSEVHGMITLHIIHSVYIKQMVMVWSHDTSLILYTFIRGSWCDHITHPSFCTHTSEVHSVITLHIPHSVHIHQRFIVWSHYTSPILYTFIRGSWYTVKILKFGTPNTTAIIVLKLVKFDVTLHWCIQKKLMQWQTA